MKVLLFIGSLTGGGAERVAVALTRHLARKGHSVDIITMHDAERDFYTLPDDVDRVSLGLAGESQGFRKLTANLTRLRSLRAVLKREQADVVVGMMTTSAVLCILAAWGLRTRVVASERNYPGRKPCTRPWAFLRRVFYRFADAHVAQTREAANWLRTRTGARAIHIIPNSVGWPIPDCPPAIAPKTLLDERQHLVLAAGTKPHQKGFDLLLDAFAGVADSYPSWRLVILGVSSSTDEGVVLSERARELGIEQQVMLPGRVGNVSDWYQRAELFVLSSRYEGFPNVLLEAMAAGCASVAFDCDTGPRDVIEQDVNAVLVPAEDVDALQATMARLMADEGLRMGLGEQAVAVRETFSEERVMTLWDRALQ